MTNDTMNEAECHARRHQRRSEAADDADVVVEDEAAVVDDAPPNRAGALGCGCGGTTVALIALGGSAT